MKPDQILTITISALLSVAGWFIGYLTTVRRDRLSKRRDSRTQYLLDAYRRLESAANRREPNEEHKTALESSVADVQLLGSSQQVHLARQFALEFAGSGQASLDPLLEALRLELPRELNIQPPPEGITFLRINLGPARPDIGHSAIQVDAEKQPTNGCDPH
jgi:hypothetical protein